jgi:glycosyltransferase involved in cell wall biosynthesis
MPRVSVIIPSYNHEKYVAEAIQSVLDQTYQDFEIVITDDGSSDSTVSIIKSFTDPRIKLFCFPKNQGAAVAANHCIAEAKGEFIALLNSDDAFVPEKLEKQVQFLDRNSKMGAVFSYAQFINEDSDDITHTNHLYQEIFLQKNRSRFDWLKYFFYHGNCFCHPSILIRRECYSKVGCYDPRFAQLPDFDFWIRFCQEYDCFILAENLVRFRIQKSQINASGDRPEVWNRFSFELPIILEQYLNPEVLENFTKIFPEAIEDMELCINGLENKNLIKFLIARLALASKISAVQYFGISTIYRIFSDNKESLKEIKELYSFDFVDLIDLAGKQSVFLDSKHVTEMRLTIEMFKNSRWWKIYDFGLKIKKQLKI